MAGITWKGFERKNENCERYSFEVMCRLLFKSMFPQVEYWPNINPNNPGIEMPPQVIPGTNRVVGFQSKYIEEKTETKLVYNQIKDSIETTIKYYVFQAIAEGKPKITEFYLYCNRSLGSDSDAYKVCEQRLAAHGIKLIAICNEHILDKAMKDQWIRGYFFDEYQKQPELATNLSKAEIEKKVCEALSNYIERLNLQLDWEEKGFTPIEAEAELDKNEKKKRYQDLMTCIDKNQKKDRIFLILGEPGSGKSVSLRKYCHDRLKNGKEKEIPYIPIYLNLKNWNIIWSMNSLPKQTDVKEFVKAMFIEQMEDAYTEATSLEAYFKKLFDAGRFYFVFDSFDELPCLVGMEHTEELIKHLSLVLYQFMTSMGQNGGMIASRLFRQPAENSDKLAIISLCPFDERRIQMMIDRTCGDGKDHAQRLFQKRPDLGAMASNPLLLSLLVHYMSHNANAFPDDQMHMYSSFITSRIGRELMSLHELGISSSKVNEAASKMAQYMQMNSDVSRECPIHLLEEAYPEIQAWVPIVQMLVHMKICKYGGRNLTVSFAHRRFQEYFLVKYRKDEGVFFSEEDLNSITTSGGARDALVLYNEIAEPKESEKILKYCLHQIYENLQYSGQLRLDGCIALINTITFMVEAFRNKKDVFWEYEEEYAEFLDNIFQANSMNTALGKLKKAFEENVSAADTFAELFSRRGKENKNAEVIKVNVNDSQAPVFYETEVADYLGKMVDSGFEYDLILDQDAACESFAKDITSEEELEYLDDFTYDEEYEPVSDQTMASIMRRMGENAFSVYNMNIIVQQAFTESICLLREENQNRIMVDILELDNFVLEEIALKQTRQNRTLDREVEMGMASYYNRESAVKNIKEYKKRKYTFSFSSQLGFIRFFLDCKIIFYILTILYPLIFILDSAIHRGEWYIKIYELTGSTWLWDLLLALQNMDSPMLRYGLVGLAVIMYILEVNVLDVTFENLNFILMLPLLLTSGYAYSLGAFSAGFIMIVAIMFKLIIIIRYGKTAFGKTLGWLIYTCIVALIAISLMIFGGRLGEAFLKGFNYVYAVVIVLFVVPFALDLIRTLRYKKVTEMTREDLEKKLQAFQTDDARVRYLLRLKSDQVKLSGNWTNGKEPFYDSPEIMLILSQLDGKDLSLARYHF